MESIERKLILFCLISLAYKMQEEKAEPSEPKLTDWKSEIEVFNKKREEAEKEYNLVLKQVAEEYEIIKKVIETEENEVRNKISAKGRPNHIIYCQAYCVQAGRYRLIYKYACRNCAYITSDFYKWSEKEMKEHERKLNLGGEIQHGVI